MEQLTRIAPISYTRKKYGFVHQTSPAIEITTMVGCPLMCTFCPQENLRESYGESSKYMQVSDLKIILSKLPPNTRIDFSGMAEPWANPNCTEMLEIVLEMGFTVAIYTTLYGMKDPDKVASLLEKYSDQIEIVMLHLPDANNNMKGWKYSDEWMKAYEIISSIKIQCGVSSMTMDGSGIVHSDLNGITTSLRDWRGHTRAGSLDTEKLNSQAVVITPHNNFSLTCASSPFFDRNVLLPNGDVVLCCMDYNLEHIIGNLIRDKYSDLFKSAEMMRIIDLNESPLFSKCSICKSCENVKRIESKELMINNIKKFIKKLITL